jgi:hypothetical protein
MKVALLRRKHLGQELLVSLNQPLHFCPSAPIGIAQASASIRDVRNPLQTSLSQCSCDIVSSMLPRTLLASRFLLLAASVRITVAAAGSGEPIAAAV